MGEMVASRKASFEEAEEASTSSSKPALQPETKPNTKEAGNSLYGKALAKRAVYGSHNNRNRGRRNGARLMSPSRLSKVSLADEAVE